MSGGDSFNRTKEKEDGGLRIAAGNSIAEHGNVHSIVNSGEVVVKRAERKKESGRSLGCEVIGTVKQTNGLLGIPPVSPSNSGRGRREASGSVGACFRRPFEVTQPFVRRRPTTRAFFGNNPKEFSRAARLSACLQACTRAAVV